MRVIYFVAICFVFRCSSSIDLCKQHKTCHNCIRDANKCVWCDSHKFNDTKCKSAAEQLENWCPHTIINPKSVVKVITNNDFSSERGKVIHMKPQQIQINIRPGDVIDFDFSFRKAQNYPVDLYFLLDGSASMASVKNEIVKQTESIYQMMKSMTDNVYLGMGSFVDKNLLPFTNVLNSTNTYSFRNRLKLINDPEAFKKTINDTAFGYNYDEQEGTLDALAQVIVCKEQIGWREESRKIILVFTGASFHAASDGIFGGVVEPYDGKCYLENDVYSKETVMDYPSVGIINKLASEDEKIIIFAIDEEAKNIYKSLTNFITGSKVTKYGGDLIANMLKTVYEEISQNLKLKVNMDAEHRKNFEFFFNPDCYNAYRQYEDCEVVHYEEKHFTGTIKLLSYIENDSVKMDIVFEGIKEKIELDISIIKRCDCKREENSTSCNYHGSLYCGICECEENRYYGDSCQCQNTTSALNPSDEATCIAPGSNSTCHNRGSCKCGMCKCRNGYKGKFCECSDHSCERGADNELCSGPLRGVCDCGKCNCKSGWTGSVCDCSTSKTECLSNDQTLCSNRGVCICGRCKCNDISDWDVRTKEQPDCQLSCPQDNQDPSSCRHRQCINIEPIVLCHLNSDDCQPVDNLNITLIKNLTMVQAEGDWYHCSRVIVDVGCYTKFLYRYSKDKYGIEIVMDKNVDCIEANYIRGFICLFTLIFIGVGTLIAWKYWTDRRDRLEYEKLFQQVNETETENVLFVPPLHSYRNPSYQGHL
ncbi:putative myospheroid protein [Danaus plexippus plexippus]|uniref:Integrin beta n=1 Tax=Danaus plexippus plexippus TaxID=278856 RepID=A0A212FB70_DANPL|nr:putative myospheroid protein [Danaus plexippus plexippus]